MEAIKHIVKVSRNHEIKVKVPQDIPENEIVEMILIIKKRQDSFEYKIKELKESMKDKLFMIDVKETAEDFKMIDSEGWK